MARLLNEGECWMCHRSENEIQNLGGVLLEIPVGAFEGKQNKISEALSVLICEFCNQVVHSDE